MKAHDLVENLQQKIKDSNATDFDLIDADGQIINCVQIDHGNKLIRLYRKMNTNMSIVDHKQEQIYHDDGGIVPSIKIQTFGHIV